MADPFIAEIRMFGFNFPPRGWASCDGQLMAISQNTALFSLLGTTYGGDGKVTFALPNLQDRVPMHPGDGPGLTPRFLGENGGAENIALIVSEMPAHTHPAACNSGNGTQYGPGNNFWAQDAGGANEYAGTGPNTMNPLAVGAAGGSLPHNNLQPYLVNNFCIATQGVFPARS
jgi:microcystin-dependent protein